MNEKDKIILYPSNWLYNAGVVGFLRVLEFAKKEKLFNLNDDGSVEIHTLVLEDFETYYFEYVTKFSFLDRIDKVVFQHLRNSIKKKYQAGSKQLQDKIKKINQIENEIKKMIISLDSKENWTEFIKELRNMEKKFEEKIKEENDLVDILEKNFEETKKNFNRLIEEISGFKVQADFLGRFYFNKGVVANPKGKKLDRPQNFKKAYLDPIKNLKSGEIVCVLCGNKYHKESMSQLTEGDFSVIGISTDKFANFYNFYTQNGLSHNKKCCLCQLILLCAFAGFNLKPFQLRELDGTDYIFVNYPSFNDALEINNRLYEKFKNYEFEIFTERINTYLESFKVVLEVVQKKSRWLLENIYFAEIMTSPRKDRVKPKFVYFNIDKALAEIYQEFDIGRVLRDLSFNYEISKNNYVNLSTEVLKRLIEKKRIIYIAFKIASEKLNNEDKDFSPIWNLILLEFLLNQKRRLKMSAKTAYGILKRIQETACKSFTLEEIDPKKRFHIAQRFLTLIRGARKEDFYNELMRLFIVYEKQIPEEIFSILTESEELTFQEKALAFLTGFVNPSELKDKKGYEEKGGGS